MIRSTRGIAATVAALVSLSVVGAALANEPEDPILEGQALEACEGTDAGTDEGTDGTDGTTEEGTTGVGADGTDGTTEEGTVGSDGTDGTTDGGSDPGAVGDGTDGTAEGADDCATTTDGATDGSDGTDGTAEGTEGTDGLEASTDGLEASTDGDAADGEEGERPQNHGWYVSEATKTCPESGRERGACISDVAKSDLGKPHAAEDEAEGTSEVGRAESGPKAKPAKAPKGGGRGGKKG